MIKKIFITTLIISTMLASFAVNNIKKVDATESGILITFKDNSGYYIQK